MVLFERLVSRSVVRFLSEEMDLAGIKMSVDRLLQIMIIGVFALFVIVSFGLYIELKLNQGIAAFFGVVAAVVYVVVIYAVMEFIIDQRKNFVESILPDYLQLTSANVRSGVALDKAMILATRPEFKYFNEDVKLLSKQLYAGETMQNALALLASKYRSLQMKHTTRMISEALQYGGGMTDLLNQIAKDIRNQQTIQKEISGQLFMYTLFIAFAALIGAPVLYALTNQMMGITDTIWAGILSQNGGKPFPSTGISILKPQPPSITPTQYQDFAIAAVLIITGMASFIVSSIASGSVLKGLRYLPIFLIMGMVVFFVVSLVIKGMFASISGG